MRRRKAKHSGPSVQHRLPHGAHALPIVPTPRAMALLALFVILDALAKELTDPVAAATSLTCLFIVLAGLISAVAVFLHAALKRTVARCPANNRPAYLALAALNALAAKPTDSERTWVQLDQLGNCIGTFTGASEPHTRGMFRSAGTRITYRDLFGCWKVRQRRADADELLIPPPAHITPSCTLQELLPASVREYANPSTRDTQRIRAYEKGDPLHAISWKHTAHHGALMSHELDRAASIAPLVLLDTIESEDIEALAIEAATAFEQLAHAPRDLVRAEEILVSDGAGLARGCAEARRFIAALQPAAPDPSTSAMGPKSDVGHFAAQEVASRVHLACNIATRDITGTLRPIILITRARNGMWETALRAHVDPNNLRVLVARDTVNPSVVHGAEEHRRTQPIDEASSGKQQTHKPRRTGIAYAVASGIPCFATFAFALSLSRGLIDEAPWYPAGLILFGIACAGSTVGTFLAGKASRTVRLLLAGISCVLIVALGIFLALQDLYAPGIGMSAPASGGGLIPLRGIDLFSFIPIALETGFRELIVGQWVPVSVGSFGNIALILTLTATAIAVRLLILPFPAIRPLISLLPLAVLSLRVVFLGEDTNWTATFFCLLLGIALMLLHGRQRFPRAQREDSASRIAATASHVLCAGCIALFACAASPQIANDSHSSPFAWFNKLDSTVAPVNSPLVDLKRDLTQPQETTALRYSSSADAPLYLRLMTLDTFDGNTWLMDANAAPRDSNRALADRPGYFGGIKSRRDPLLSAHLISGGVPQGASVVTVDITIDNLVSSQLPTPGTPVFAFCRTTESWVWNKDGIVTSSNAKTESGLTYQAQALYLEPISSLSDLDDLPSLHADIHDLANPASLDVQPDERYLALPDQLPEHIATAIAQAHNEIARASNSDSETPFVQQLDALRWLIAFFTDGSFIYSIDAPDGEGEDNLSVIDTFLQKRKGYCMHYASASALLGRALGLPTRMVLGYRAAGQADEQGEYAVSNHQLHGWTEVFLTGIGWVPVDITPTQGSSGDESSDIAVPDTPLSPETPADEPQPETLDVERTSENDSDEASRDHAAPSLDKLVQDAWNSLSPTARNLLRAASALAAAGVAVAVLFGTRRAYENVCISHAATRPRHAAEAAWRRTCRIARRYHVRWNSPATEEDIAHAAGVAGFIELAEVVCVARYAQTPVPLEPKHLTGLIDQIRRELADQK